MHRLICRGYTDVVDADLAKFFDTIPHPHGDLMQSVARPVDAGTAARRGAVRGSPDAGARIVEDVYLENAKLIRPIEIVGSQIEGAIKLSHARTDSLIVLDGSLMNGTFAANSLHSESDLSLAHGAAFKNLVRLDGAKIDGDVNMPGASFDGTLDGNSLHVGGSLAMASDDQNNASFNDVVLTGAKIAGQIDMTGASFGGKLDAAYLQAGAALFMGSEGQKRASFKDVVLRGANITGSGNLNLEIWSSGGYRLKKSATINAAFVLMPTGTVRIGGVLLCVRFWSSPTLSITLSSRPLLNASA